MTTDTSRDILRRCRFTPYRKGMGPTFILVTWDLHKQVEGHSYIGYELSMHQNKKKIILFQGHDFGNSPLHCIDSNASILSLMGFLTLRPGDTDEDYFQEYTQIQLDYCEQHAEYLSNEVTNRFGE